MPPAPKMPLNGQRRPTPKLRQDLQWLTDDEPRRATRSSTRRIQRLLHDPLTRTFARIDGELLDDLQHAPQDCDPQWIAAADAAGLLQTRKPDPRPRRWTPASLLYVRLPGLPSAPLAARLAPISDLLFSPLAVLAWLTFIVLAAAAVPVYWDRFQASLPGLQQFFAAGNVPLLLATLVVTKLSHELAHATVCYRLGAKPGEIGVLLLCGAPCPYCDVTDSWRLSSAARRAWIMLAGVYVELIMAAIALLVWWYTPAGVPHFVAMNVMVVCGISTLLFNLNPLMRYDGYYVLADLCGSTNLRQEAADAFASVVVRPLAGKFYKSYARPSLRNVGLAFYHAATVVYRAGIAVVIACWILRFAESLSLRPLGLALAATLMVAVPLHGVRTMARLLRGRGAWRDVAWPRRWFVGGTSVLLLLALLLLPLPRGFQATGTIDLAEATPVYLPDAGRVQRVWADYGDRVKQGQPLVQLENMPLRVQASEIAGKRQTLQTRSDQLRRRAIEQTALLAQWDSQQASLQTLAQRERNLDARLAALRVLAPASGVVLPSLPSVSPAHRVSPAPGADAANSGGAATTNEAITAAFGFDREPQPFEDAPAAARASASLHWSQGSWGRADGLWCRVGDPESLVVLLDIDAKQRAHVRVGDRIRVRCEPCCGPVATLEIGSISTINASTHQALGSQTRFRVACPVPSSLAAQWPIGAPAQARLRLPGESLAERTGAWIKDLLRGR
ncbi:hypothetical protein [Roseimaritima ulvae]|uniref:HlyD family secretion protein n=1 Tax=Roseimaritima ulvae TaxID=980254 RepID=A0A5B9QK60_9BACT|nr:hypothetical protein [Roseimaritima ulvae]QEG39448.1 HlyD family secretion protein [Roseimaritima ulvae]